MAVRARVLRMLAWLILGLVALLAAGVLAGSAAMNQRSNAPAGTRITVHAGTSLRAVLGQLAGVHAVALPRLTELYLRARGEALRAQAGTYELAPQATVRQILQQLREGGVLLEQLTIVEGWTFAQMRAAIDASPTLVHDLRGLDASALMSALGEVGTEPEGQFFPDSYRYAAGTSDRHIYERARQRMRERLQAEWQERTADLPIGSAREALILASIIEKETAREDERARVAAVFVNRLRAGMRLQTDPTVIYGLGERYDGTLHRRDLEADGPYNSYTREGLPPTPIALPGGASLHAALHPANEKVLYFVATGLGDGSHHFSTTYAEHGAALRAYLQRIGVHPERSASGGGG